MKKKIALIFGGRSAEHEVSINSAKNIFKAIDLKVFEPILLGVSKQGSWYRFTSSDVFEKFKSLNDSDLKKEEAITLISFEEKPFIFSLRTQEKTAIDAAFPIIHGTMGEDGTLQGYFKILNLPFVGCGVLASAISMDKEYMKRVMTEANIPNSKYLVLHQSEATSFQDISKKLGLPFFIKPANAGSSVGVHKIKSEADFKTKIQDSFLYDRKVIAEEFIQGREIECSVLGLNLKSRASLPGELVVHHEFYSYEAKYIDADGAEIVIPAHLTATQIQQIQQMAVQTFDTLFCDGFARVDFFLRPDGQVYVNEINTLPGFTKISMYPKMWEASGLKYTDLITKLIELSFEKHHLDNQIKLSF